VPDFTQVTHCAWCTRSRTETLSGDPGPLHRPTGWYRLDGPGAGLWLCSAQCLAVYALNHV
jgi:hypothetical protein